VTPPNVSDFQVIANGRSLIIEVPSVCHFKQAALLFDPMSFDFKNKSMNLVKPNEPIMKEQQELEASIDRKPSRWSIWYEYHLPLPEGKTLDNSILCGRQAGPVIAPEVWKLKDSVTDDFKGVAGFVITWKIFVSGGKPTEQAKRSAKSYWNA